MPNTTYYARVKAQGWSVDSAYLFIGNVTTTLNAPTNPDLHIDVEVSSITAAAGMRVSQSNVQYAWRNWPTRIRSMRR